MAKLSKIRLLTKVVCLENIIYLHYAKEEFKRAIFLKEMTVMATKQRKIIVFTSLSWLLLIIIVPQLSFIPHTYLTKTILASLTIAYIVFMTVFLYRYFKLRKISNK